MRPRVALVGAGGYGDYHLRLLREQVDPDSYTLAGVVDPYLHAAPQKDWIASQRIPVFDTLEQFYKEQGAELAIIATPIPLHKAQCLTALAAGSHVLCEKPIAPTLQDAREMEQAAKRAGRYLGVGFQWSFCAPMLRLKRDILSGRLGAPLLLKSYVSWPRYDGYYQGSAWKGRLRDGAGRLVLDSILTNATAHHLHNLFFLMGDALDASALPAKVQAGLYRAKPIETFDTAFVAGAFANGCRFLNIATHSAEVARGPLLSYRFTGATVTLDSQGLLARFADGHVQDYGDPSSQNSDADKTRALLAAAGGDGSKVTCVVHTALPHLTVCNALFDQAPIHAFPQALRYRTDSPAGDFITGLAELSYACFAREQLPSQLGDPWAAPEHPLALDGYTRFLGAKCGGPG